MSEVDGIEIDPEEQARLDEEKRVIEEERIKKEYEENRARVAFTPASVKYICSKHAGSILATSEPSLSKLRSAVGYKDLIEKAINIFNQELTNQNRLEDKTLPNTSLVDLLYNMGFDKKKEALQDIIDKLFIKQTENINENTNNMNTETVFEMKEGDMTNTTTQLATEVYLTEFIDEIQFCDIVTRFEAPSFFYGQRLRRNAGRGQVQEMIELIIRGCNPNTADGEGLTSLHYASEFNRLDVIRALFEICGESLMLNPRDKYGWTPLYCAAHHGNIEVVKLLLEIGADTSVSNAQQKTPLHCAASQGRREICEILIRAGASLNAQDKHSVTPLHDCNFKGHYDLFQWLINGDSVSTSSEIIEPADEGDVVDAAGDEGKEQESKPTSYKPGPREIIKDILGYTPEDYGGEYKYQEDVKVDLEELSIKAESKSSRSPSRSPSRESKRSKQSERSQRK
jgi:hypothetical protein